MKRVADTGYQDQSPVEAAPEPDGFEMADGAFQPVFDCTPLVNPEGRVVGHICASRGDDW